MYGFIFGAWFIAGDGLKQVVAMTDLELSAAAGEMFSLSAFIFLFNFFSLRLYFLLCVFLEVPLYSDSCLSGT